MPLAVPTIYVYNVDDWKEARALKLKNLSSLHKFKSDSFDAEPAERTGETTDDALDTHDEAETWLPETEKVFVKSIEYDDVTNPRGYTPSKRAQLSEETQSKRTRLDISKVPSDYAEQIYEFGKFVAEQLLCLSVDEARLAQIEIRDVLLKYYENKDSLTELVACNEKLVKEEIFEAEEEQIGLNVNIDKLSVTQSVSEANIAGPSFTQAASKVNIDKPSVSKLVPKGVNAKLSPNKPVLPQLNIVKPLVKIGKLKLNQSDLKAKTAALTRVLGIRPTKPVITTRSLVTQPSQHLLSVESSVAQPFPAVIPTESIVTQPSSRLITVGSIATCSSTRDISTGSQISQPREISALSSVTQPIPIVISAGSIVTQPSSRASTTRSTVSQPPIRMISTGSLAQTQPRVISAVPPVTQPFPIVISAGSIITQPSPIVISAGSIIIQSPVISVGSLKTRPSPHVVSSGSVMTQPFRIKASAGSLLTPPSRKTLSGSLVEVTADSGSTHVHVYK